jgi:hypothetical protein
MRVVVYVAGAALISSAVACSHAVQEPQVPHPEASAALDSTPRTSLERAKQLVVAANLELHDLGAIRAVAVSDADRAEVDTQIVAIRQARDELQSSLPAAHEPADAARLKVASSNLERAMRAGAVTEPQVPAQPPLGRPRTRTLPYGADFETTTPYR